MWKRSALSLSRFSSNCVCKSIVHGGHSLVVAVSGLSGSVRTAVWFARKGWHGSSVRAFFVADRLERSDSGQVAIRAVQAQQAVWFGLVRLLQVVCVFF